MFHEYYVLAGSSCLRSAPAPVFSDGPLSHSQPQNAMKSPDPAPLGIPVHAGMEMTLDAALEEPKQPFTSYLMDRLAALRFFTFSALIHVVLLLLVGGTVIYKNMEEAPDFAPEDIAEIAKKLRKAAGFDKPTGKVATKDES